MGQLERARQSPAPGCAGRAGNMPIADYFEKGITMGSGQAPVNEYNEYLRDLIMNDKAQPSEVISHRIRIDDAPEAYDKFDKPVDGYTKVLIKFAQAA